MEGRAGCSGAGQAEAVSSRELDERARRWAEELAQWAIPEEILGAAPEPPWGFPRQLFERHARAAVEDDAGTPARHAAKAALGGGGTVLDVGAGAGAASLPLAPPASHVFAVDESAPMLEALSLLAAEKGVPCSTLIGHWPDAAADVPAADVVVCNHVLYNVAGLVGFLDALASHARRRVVVEITARHPLSELNPLWRALHGIDRPEAPVAEDVLRLLGAMGIQVRAERYKRPSMWAQGDEQARIALARKRLCVGPERDPEIARLLRPVDPELVGLWWDVGGSSPTPG